MNFTREPIIETVITPKEGYKLIVRNSKGVGQEEYAVDAIEVVSFGHSFFYRSTERPKSFLVPVSDYEVVEAKETRVVLKNATFERSIKIGGGREASVKAPKEKPAPSAEEQEPAAVEQRLEKKRERRRHRRRRSGSDEEKVAEETTEIVEEVKTEEEAAQAPPPVMRRLIPPPTQLIAEKISKERAKEVSEEPAEQTASSTDEEEPKRSRRKRSEEIVIEEEILPDSEGGEVQRMAAETAEAVTSTTFSSIEEKGKFSFFGKIW
ncbi:MAG: hypothetical protein JSS30_07565 [Verrucomicrobia bacterium]|nr:hypothetical protein [Verrucomicrobiota bacterium]